MANPVNLFPSRVPFVNPDGTLTAEAYRALTALSNRVGGQASNAVPSSTDLETIFGAFVSESQQELVSDSTVQINFEQQVLEQTMVAPQIQEPLLPNELQQQINEPLDYPIPQVGNRSGLPAQLVTVGASPYTFTVPYDCGVVINTATTQELIRQGTAMVMARSFEASENDQVRITYAVAPTVYLLPR